MSKRGVLYLYLARVLTGVGPSVHLQAASMNIKNCAGERAWPGCSGVPLQWRQMHQTRELGGQSH